MTIPAPLFVINTDGSLTISIPTQLTGGGKIPNGTFAQIPVTPAPGDFYLALDQPKGQQLYLCGASGEWEQQLNLGGSGALQIQNGSLDINLAVVPLLESANQWTGLNQFKDVNFTGTITGLPSSAPPPLVWSSAWQTIPQTFPGSTETSITFDTNDPRSTPGITHDGANFTITIPGAYSGFAQFNTESYFGAVDLAVYQTNLAGVRTRIARSTVADTNRAWDGLGGQIGFSFYAEQGDSLSFSIGAGTGLTTTPGPGQTQFTIWKL